MLILKSGSPWGSRWGNDPRWVYCGFLDFIVCDNPTGSTHMVGLYVEIQMNTYLYAYLCIYTVYTCIIFLYVASLRKGRFHGGLVFYSVRYRSFSMSLSYWGLDFPEADGGSSLKRLKSEDQSPETTSDWDCVFQAKPRRFLLCFCIDKTWRSKQLNQWKSQHRRGGQIYFIDVWYL